MVVQGGSAAGRERDEGVFMSRVSFDLVHTFPCTTPRLHAVLIWMVNSSIDTTLPAPAEQSCEHHMLSQSAPCRVIVPTTPRKLEPISPQDRRDGTLCYSVYRRIYRQLASCAALAIDVSLHCGDTQWWAQRTKHLAFWTPRIDRMTVPRLVSTWMWASCRDNLAKVAQYLTTGVQQSRSGLSNN